MQQLYDRIFPDKWFSRMGEPEIWQKIYEVDPGELWETHYAAQKSPAAICTQTDKPTVPSSRRE